MSLYNMMNGVNPATFTVLPMLGKHPDEYPRFRDCFLGSEDHPNLNEHIHVYTRVGGGNRESYAEQIEVMRSNKNFVIDFDDSFDSTFASFVFNVPEEFKEDFKLIVDGKFGEVSSVYQEQLRKVYPKLNEQWDSLWPTPDEVKIEKML